LWNFMLTPVVKPDVKPVVQPVGNRLYRVNRVLNNQVCHHTYCSRAGLPQLSLVCTAVVGYGVSMKFQN